MNNIVDIRVPRLAREMTTSVVEANRVSYQIPQCKMVRDFLSLYNLPWQAFFMPFALIDAIPADERKDFGEHLEMLHRRIEERRSLLRIEYGVMNEDELPHERRVFFDAALHAFIESEDHYP